MTRLPLIALFVLAAACSKKSEPQPEPAPATTAPAGGSAAPAPAAPTAAASPADEAKQIFGTLCATCHGATGKGDGAAAASLNPKPRDYTDKAWQASVTDDQLAKAILEGGQAVGKSAMMPPNPQLKDKPEVIAELVKIVRSFGK